MHIHDKFLDTLRSRLSLAEMIGKKVKLTRKGREFTGLCPFHHEKTPSFTVNEEKEFYHCFGCGAHGDGIKFLMETQSYSFLEAVCELARSVGLDLPEEPKERSEPQQQLVPLKNVLKATGDWFQKNLLREQGVKALRYIEKRGLTRETIRKFGLGYAPGGYHTLETYLTAQGFSLETLLKAGISAQADDRAPYDRFRERLMFPIQNLKGEIVGFGGRLLEKGEPKYLNSPETPLFSKGKLLYGYPQAKEKGPSDPLLIVEGYMDVLSLSQAGFKGAVAPLGTALTEDQILQAWRLSPEPILCFDGDMAGLRAALRAAERVLPLLKPGYSLRFIFLPSGEDPDTLVQRGDFFQDVEKKAHSLLETLWIFLTNGKAFKTPESKAALQEQYNTWAKAIAHPDIQKNYTYAFKELFYKHIIGVKKEDSLIRSPKKVGLNFLLIHERLLLAILLNHPQIINELSDELAEIDFKDKRHQELRDAILQCYVEKPLDVESVRAYLVDKGFEQEVKTLLSPQVLIHGAFAKASAPLEEVQRGWKEIINRLQALSSQNDLKAAKEDLAEQMSDKTWKRLKVLKEITTL